MSPASPHSSGRNVERLAVIENDLMHLTSRVQTLSIAIESCTTSARTLSEVQHRIGMRGHNNEALLQDLKSSFPDLHELTARMMEMERLRDLSLIVLKWSGALTLLAMTLIGRVNMESARVFFKWWLGS